jgi:hypothetical protein
MTDHVYFGRVIQDGQPVAQVSSADLVSMLKELRHYAAVYEQDSPVKLQMRAKGGRWKVL